jgi:hypothetical protein
MPFLYHDANRTFGVSSHDQAGIAGKAAGLKTIRHPVDKEPDRILSR